MRAMTLALAGLGIISMAELLIWERPFWNRRRLAATLSGVALAAASLVLLAANPAVWTVLLVLLSLYRLVNLARIAAGRIQADYLFHASRRTSLWLIGCQLIVTGAAAAGRYYSISTEAWWTAAAGAGLAAASVILISAWRHLRTTRPPALTRNFSDAELPSLTVAIPARNETADLEECLGSLVASTYPKLEILVLDDCSQDKRTPEIIRGFAHTGVRFIGGQEPPDSWLAKNFAYDQLTDASSGDLLLFCGVDTRFQPASLDTLVRTLLQKEKDMISLLPRNLEPASKGLAAWFMQPSRYAWELALPRRLIRRPPVLSTCWIITRQALRAAGGFEAVRRKGVPESYLARNAAAGDGYAFLQSDARMGITCVKSPAEQRATAVRTRYLQLHRRPELAVLISVAEAGVLIMPLIIAAAALASGNPWIAAPAVLAFAAETAVYARLVNLAYRRFIIKGLWLLPFAALYDIGLLNYSMWRYEFREVLWKGRNVCVPVMRVIPKLPES